MSGHDLYLVLRERVETVAEGFFIGKDALDAAQSARGFSHERMGRELGISEKTWRRWKEKGVVPYGHLDNVAAVLRLEIERPRQRIADATADGRLQEVLGAIEALRGEVQAVRDLVADLREDTPQETPGRRRGRSAR